LQEAIIIKSVADIGRYFNKPERAAYLFILPAFSIMTVFLFVPLIMAVGISCFNINIFLTNIKFSGLSNYAQILQDARFLNALKNTLYFTFLEMPIHVALGLLVAVYVSKNMRFRRFLRSVYYVPTVCSMTAVGIVWTFLLDPQIGLYTYYSSLFGLPNLGFLKDPAMAMPTVVLLTVWKNFGSTMVVLTGGILSISQSYYEAAEIDGAGAVAKFFKVTLPMLVPTLGFCVITNTMANIQVFDQIYIMTQGGPLYRTETAVAYIYKVGFQRSPMDLGYASALAVVLSLMIGVIALTMNRYFLQKEPDAV